MRCDQFVLAADGWSKEMETSAFTSLYGIYGNVKKQFVAQSVICNEILTTAMENELVKTNKHQFCFPC